MLVIAEQFAGDSEDVVAVLAGKAEERQVCDTPDRLQHVIINYIMPNTQNEQQGH